MIDLETISFWNDIKLKKYPPLTKDIKCDVCVIGAGISGLMSAFLLSKSGKRVVVVDDGPVAGGQTNRTTGHLTNALDDRYHVLESYFGKEGSKLAADSHRAAIDLIATLVSEHKIDCDFAWVNAYLFTPDNPNELAKELAAAKRAGLSVKKVHSCPFSSFDTGPAISFSHQAEFHPLKFIKHLCHLIEAQDGEIFSNTHVQSIEKEFELETSNGLKIQATHVIVATNSPINSRFFPHLKQASYRTYVIAAQTPKDYIPQGLFYDTLDPYHYIRIATGEKGEEYAIIGGEDHRTGEEKNIKERFQNLEAWARTRFPKMGPISHFWSGQIIEPVDSLAFIGRVRKDQELYIITGDSGNGLTHGTLGAILINDLILKKESPWETLYNPHRITLNATHEFLKENVNMALQYKDWFTKGEKKGSGKVIREGLKKCTYYKDEKGKVHKKSAICPHLGAILHWNEVEQCWECPAHGSRFAATGEVLQGPANCDLKEC